MGKDKKNVDAEKSAKASKAVESQPRKNGKFDSKPVKATTAPSTSQTPREKVKEDPNYQKLIQTLESKYRDALASGIPDFLGEGHHPGPARAPREELELMLAAPELMVPLEKIANLTKEDLKKLLSLSKGFFTKSRVKGTEYVEAEDKTNKLAKKANEAFRDNLWHLIGDKIRPGIYGIIAESHKYDADESELLVINRIINNGVRALLVKDELTQAEYDSLAWPIKKVIPNW